MKYTDLVIALNLSSFFISVVFIAFIMHEKSKTSVQYSYLFLQICISIWCFGSVFSIITKDNFEYKFWIYVQYFGISFIGAAILIFALTFLQLKLSTNKILLILSPSILTLFAVLTNEFHHRFYLSINYGHIEYGELFWIHCLITYAYIFVSAVIYSIHIIKKETRNPAVLMLISIIIPCITNILVIFDIININNIDLTIVSFNISNIILCITIFNYMVFDIMPIALKSLVLNIDQGILIFNTNKKVIEYNFNMFEMFKYLGISIQNRMSLDELIIQVENKDFQQKFIINEMLNSIKHNIISNQKVNIYAKEPNRYFELGYSSIVNENNLLLGYILLSKDVTEYIKLYNEVQNKNDILEKKNIEISELYEQEQTYNELTNNFLSIVSHEFRTPINVIQCALQILDKNSLKGSNEKWINMIKQNSLRLTRLVNNILDYSKIDAGLMELKETKVEIVSFIDEIIDSILSYTDSKNIILQYIPKSDSIYSIVDKEKLERVILNLLSNATKFTKENGKILVTVWQSNSSFYISVKDNGIGIQPDMQEIIFQKFRQVDNTMTRETEGSGIGLALCNIFTNIMGGKIILDSQYGVGSEFIIYLPKKCNDSEETLQYPQLAEEDIDEKVNLEFSDIDTQLYI